MQTHLHRLSMSAKVLHASNSDNSNSKTGYDHHDYVHMCSSLPTSQLISCSSWPSRGLKAAECKLCGQRGDSIRHSNNPYEFIGLVCQLVAGTPPMGAYQQLQQAQSHSNEGAPTPPAHGCSSRSDKVIHTARAMANESMSCPKALSNSPSGFTR